LPFAVGEAEIQYIGALVVVDPHLLDWKPCQAWSGFDNASEILGFEIYYLGHILSRFLGFLEKKCSDDKAILGTEFLVNHRKNPRLP